METMAKDDAAQEATVTPNKVGVKLSTLVFFLGWILRYYYLLLDVLLIVTHTFSGKISCIHPVF